VAALLGLTAITAVLALGAYMAAGSQYQSAVRSATRVSATGPASTSHVLSATGHWLGILLVVCAGAAVVITWRHRSLATSLLAWVLVAAAAVPTVLAARQHATTNLYPDAALGAWFGATVAGWLLALVFDAGRRGGEAVASRPALLTGRGLAMAAILASAAIGALATSTQFHAWPNSSAAARELAALTTTHGDYLAEDHGQFAYDQRADITVAQWSSTASYSYLDPVTRHVLTGTAAYAAAIHERHFSVIVLDGQDTPATDQAIERDIAQDKDYHQVASISFTTSSGPGRYIFWVPVT
jgi:hypothetical protein